MPRRRPGVRAHPQAMNLRFTLLFWAVAACGSASMPAHGPVGPACVTSAVPFQRGMALGIFSRGAEEDVRPQIRELALLGADSISLVVPRVLRDVRSDQFYAEAMVTPTDESLRRATRLAHAAGMRVLLFPIVYVWDLRDGEWRGTLRPSDWRRWFDNYSRDILHYARLAGEEGIEYLSVGSELCSSEAREAEWRSLIRSVRGRYPGALTYSVNWDHRHAARFLDAVDFVSMNAYFQLAEDGRVAARRIEEVWQPIVQEVDAWAAGLGKPLVIAEIGYPSRDGAATDPWDYTVEAPADPGEQAVLYSAFLKAWARSRTLSGVYFYLWWGEGGLGDTGYTPRGKPAAEVLRGWFRKQTPDREGGSP